MTKEEFNIQLERLKSAWPNFYNEERVHLIWVAVNTQYVQWFKNLINDMMASNRTAPLPQEFIDASSMRDKSIYFKNNFQNDPWKNHKSVFSNAEIKEMFQVMKDAAMGKISKHDAKKYADSIAAALRAKGINPDFYDF